ncbi:MAG: DUF4194 domain-containing protein [Chryseolinea sp.]
MSSPHSISLIALLKGIVFESQKDIWVNLIDYEADVRKYIDALGLYLHLDKSEGYAFLKQADFEPGFEMPRLIEKRQLSFQLTLICITLRKFLLENDAAGTSARAIISKQEIIERVKPFLSDTPDEAKRAEKIETQIKRVVEEGFLRPLENEVDRYEVRRIIKAFIDADKVEELLLRLREYTIERN